MDGWMGGWERRGVDEWWAGCMGGWWGGWLYGWLGGGGAVL